MLKVIHQVCCGIYVRKELVAATIASTNDKNITTYQTKHFNPNIDRIIFFFETQGYDVTKTIKEISP